MDGVLEALVWQMAESACEYCGLPQSASVLPFEVDHIIATSHGGRTIGSNLALSCFWCNRHKGPNLAGIDPQTGRVTPLFNPRRHKWERHFRWREALLVGRAPEGRATIAALKINLPLRIELRLSLMDEGISFCRQG